MRFLILLVVWCLLLAVCWPLALAVLVVLPVLWLLTIPFRVLVFVVEGMLALLRALLFLPARLLGYRS
jgi:hypothetical protein